MSRTAIIVRTVAILVLVWTGVWAVRAIAGSMKITAERLSRQVAKADFADWSQSTTPPDPALAAQRARQIDKIASMINRLDFIERANFRRDRTDERFFKLLSPQEQQRFVDLTVLKSLNSFLDSIEALPAKQRKRFIEAGVKELAEDSAGKPAGAVNPLVAGMLDKLDVKAIRAFVNQSSPATKLSLAPLVEAINESIQGLRGREFGPPRQDF